MQPLNLIIIIIINLIYIAQFDINGILTALYSHTVHTDAICAHMNIHETIIFIHIYMPIHKHIHRYMHKYISTNTLTRLPILIIITNLPIILHLHVCLGI